MNYQILNLTRVLSCCVSYSVSEHESFPEPVSNPLLIAQVLACGRPVVELVDGVAPEHQHGDNPILLWDIRNRLRGVHRVFAWTNELGWASYLGAREISTEGA